MERMLVVEIPESDRSVFNTIHKKSTGIFAPCVTLFPGESEFLEIMKNNRPVAEVDAIISEKPKGGFLLEVRWANGEEILARELNGDWKRGVYARIDSFSPPIEIYTFTTSY